MTQIPFDYQKECNDLNLALGRLLFWNNVVQHASDGNIYATPLTGPALLDFTRVPNYTDDWSACGPFIAKHQLDIYTENAFIELNGGDGGAYSVTDFPSLDAAIRFAIVKQAYVRQIQITAAEVAEHKRRQAIFAAERAALQAAKELQYQKHLKEIQK